VNNVIQHYIRRQFAKLLAINFTLTSSCLLVATKTLVHAFILMHLDYCNSVLHGTADNLL